jgi:hypothetical protein
VIYRSKGELVCECNECGEERYGGTQEFRDFVEELKDASWSITKDGDEWRHVCPDCEDT